ncbi:MAG: hypothetical protein OEW58_07830 [Gammaproteobacteria bacterium]|nr:hypothetical protein [Gammaproteobacteria bacterium]
MTRRPQILFPLLLPGLLWICPACAEKAYAAGSQYSLFSKSLTLADETHSLLSKKVVDISDSIDSFLGSERSSDELNGSYIKLRQSSVFFENGSRANYLTTQGKLDLPRTNRRLSLVIESEQTSTNESEHGHPPPIAAEQTAEQKPALITPTVQYIVSATQKWHIRANLGAQITNMEPDPTANVRIRRLFEGQKWLFRVTEKLFWYQSIGTGESTQFDLERALSNVHYFRITNLSTWLRETDNIDMAQTFTLFHDISSGRLLSYYAAAYGASRPEKQITAYALGIDYRQDLHRHWLFLDISPQALYPLQTNFKLVPSITVSLEMIIGNTGKPANTSSPEETTPSN